MNYFKAASSTFDIIKAKRISCWPLTLLAIVVIYIFAAFNATFWHKGLEILGSHVGQLLILNAAVFLLTMAFLALFMLPYIAKPFIAFILILGAVTSYYMDRLGVIIDRDMIQNVATTTLTESKHLLTLDFILYVAFFGVLPATLILFFVQIKKQKLWLAVARPIGLSALCVALSVGLLITNYKTYASVLRERKDLMSSYQPGAPIVAVIRYAKMMANNLDVVVEPLGEDAHKGPAYDTSRKPTLTIIVAGETARSQNFSLNGYAVQTNPLLAKKDIISFSNVSSCGTATATSLPCMFSKYTRDQFSYNKGVSTESLLDVLAHAGFKVEWWDNNTGDKGVAARQSVSVFTNSDNQEFCSAGECDDGILLKHLKEYLPTVTQDTVLVLHQIGSHGPTYYLRYPEEFEKFKPACRTAEFKDCTAQEITNAYDNTIAYTDYILSQAIEQLSQQDGLVTSLLYVSDHGESLGEGGLYLHGAPYFMAPEYQTKVPMILWMSDAFKRQMALSAKCLKNKTDAALSHDNLFHSVLGMMDIETNAYQANLDIFANCAEPKLLANNGN
jgi:lipid A ethanolaminephosphotransferase